VSPPLPPPNFAFWGKAKKMSALTRRPRPPKLAPSIRQWPHSILVCLLALFLADEPFNIWGGHRERIAAIRLHVQLVPWFCFEVHRGRKPSLTQVRKGELNQHPQSVWCKKRMDRSLGLGSRTPPVPQSGRRLSLRSLSSNQGTLPALLLVRRQSPCKMGKLWRACSRWSHCRSRKNIAWILPPACRGAVWCPLRLHRADHSPCPMHSLRAQNDGKLLLSARFFHSSSFPTKALMLSDCKRMLLPLPCSFLLSSFHALKMSDKLGQTHTEKFALKCRAKQRTADTTLLHATAAKKHRKTRMSQQFSSILTENRNKKWKCLRRNVAMSL